VYGFGLTGVPQARDLLVDAPADWPSLHLQRGAPPGEGREQEAVTEDRASLWLSGGASARVDRPSATAEMRVPADTTDGALVHPYLAPVALVMAWWHGRDGFHGGAIALDGGAWAVLGDKEAGKSTTLAALALAGVEVVSDDVLILDGDGVFAGPRSVDLRPDAARRLGVGEPLGHVGTRERWRLRLPPIAPRLPLRGCIILAWGDAPAVEPVRGRERLVSLLPHRGVRLGAVDPAGLMRLSALPQWRLVRPPDWRSLDAQRDRLLEALAG
jgi:hypothetical protein